ncbi:dihydrofolate reductase family protein [Williamsia sp.]|uniref:dihydrofolate reductase family protein n=1 Tax=Williamsia sp. TaxID=1872085 RepID=UPI002F94D027
MTSTTTVTGAVFIATSVDGYIARKDGGIDWLTRRDDDMSETGYDEFAASVDAIAMGRNTYEVGLTLDPWPYEGMRVLVVSSRLDPDSDTRVTVHRSIDDLLETATTEGLGHLYVDGGQLITACLNRKIITELTITTVPVLLGSGLPLFGAIADDVFLEHQRTTTLSKGLVQSVYRVSADAMLEA